MAQVTIDTKQAEECLTYMETKNVLKKGTIRNQVRNSISRVRRAVTGSLNFKSDPRMAKRAVQQTVYKRVIGGNVNILRPRKMENKKITVRYAKGGKSGKPRERSVSQRTQLINSYYGKDRYFLLRMINTGKNMRGHSGRKGFFNMTEGLMRTAAREIDECIDKELQKTADQFK